jgi:hypothetical protein
LGSSLKITPIQLAKRVEKWGKTLAPLGVAHFDIAQISVGDQSMFPACPDNKYPQAAVQVDPQYDKCWWYFHDDYLEACTAAELDQTIVHEWVHVAMRDFDFSLETVEAWLPEAAYTSWEQTVNHEREGLVDRLATMIYQLHSGKKPLFSP